MEWEYQIVGAIGDQDEGRVIDILSRPGVVNMLSNQDHKGTVDPAIHKAIIAGHERITKVLLDQGADVDQVNRFADTPLHAALRLGSSEHLIKLLLDYGADVNRMDAEGFGPLHIAIDGHASVSLIHRLINAGALIDGPPGQDCPTPLHVAVLSDNVEALKALLCHGAQANYVRQVESGFRGSPLGLCRHIKHELYHHREIEDILTTWMHDADPHKNCSLQ